MPTSAVELRTRDSTTGGEPPESLPPVAARAATLFVRRPLRYHARSTPEAIRGLVMAQRGCRLGATRGFVEAREHTGRLGARQQCISGYAEAVAARVYATIGRSPDNDVVLDHPSVLNHHLRLSWAARRARRPPEQTRGAGRGSRARGAGLAYEGAVTVRSSFSPVRAPRNSASIKGEIMKGSDVLKQKSGASVDTVENFIASLQTAEERCRN